MEEDRNRVEIAIEPDVPTTAELFVDEHGELTLEPEEATPEEHGYGYGV